MSPFRFFDSDKAVTFGKTVVEEYAKIRALVDSNKKHAGRKADRTVGLIRKVAAFARTEKLNFYARSKMLAEIRNGLKDAGIEDAEVKEFVRALLLEALRPPPAK
jgi:hypothetical protein